MVAGGDAGLGETFVAELAQGVDPPGVVAQDHLGEDLVIIVAFDRVQIGVVTEIDGGLGDGAKLLGPQGVGVIHNLLDRALLEGAHLPIQHPLFKLCQLYHRNSIPFRSD